MKKITILKAYERDSLHMRVLKQQNANKNRRNRYKGVQFHLKK